MQLEDIVVVSPDIGGVSRARRVAKMLDVPMAIVDKVRPRHNEAEVVGIIGDIEGKNVILFDDMIDTAGTVCAASNVLKKNGAKDVYAMCVHGVFSGSAFQRINESPIKEVIVTNSIPLKGSLNMSKFKVLSLAKPIGDAINCVHRGSSMIESGIIG